MFRGSPRAGFSTGRGAHRIGTGNMHHAADFITAHMKIDVLVDIAGALERCTVKKKRDREAGFLSAIGNHIRFLPGIETILLNSLILSRII